jgi:hypothetical protein
VGKHRYRITIGGGLGEAGREAFKGFKIGPEGQSTTLVADLDQSALFSALNRIQSLGLELVELIRVADDGRVQGKAPGGQLAWPGPTGPAGLHQFETQ